MKKLLSALLTCCLLLVSLPAHAETLVFRGFGLSWNAQQAFEEMCPDITIETMSANNKEDAITQALTNRDDSFDVFTLRVNYVYTRMLEKGLLGDLSGSEALTADMADLDPNILSLLTDAEGRLRAYPAAMYLSGWSINEGFWHLVFGDEPLPTTMEELLTAWLAYETDYADDYPDLDFDENFAYDSWCELLIREYALQYEEPGEVLVLDTPPLRRALELLSDIRDARQRAGKATMSADYENGWAEVATMIHRSGGSEIMAQFLNLDTGLPPELYGVEINAYTDLPLTFAAGDPVKLNAAMDVYVVNPYSTHQEAALRFIESAATAESDPYVTYAIHPSWTEPIENADYALLVGIFQEERATLEAALNEAEPADVADLQDALAMNDYQHRQLESARWAISPEKLAAYRAISDRLDFHAYGLCSSTGTNAQTVIHELSSRYAEGAMSLDLFLSELESRVVMMVQENQ